MSIPLVVNGITFNYPTNGEVGWGTQATGWANAMTNGTLQKTGGLFALTGDVDFGPSGGLKAAFFSSRTIPAATTGVFRLANNEFIGWRNAANTGNATIGLDAADNYRISTASVPSAAFITADGRLSLGNTNPLPSTKLTITGDNANGITSAIQATTYGFIGGTGIIGRGVGGTQASPSATVSGQLTLNLVGGTTHDGTTFNNTTAIGFESAGNPSTATSQPTNILFSTTNNGAVGRTEKMRITFDGNVGIGTTTPTNFGPGSIGLTINGLNGGVAGFHFNNTLVGYVNATASALNMDTAFGFPITFGTQSIEKMRIDTAGNVGIGKVPTGAARLDIASPTSSIVRTSGGAAANQGGAFYVTKGGLPDSALMCFGDKASIAGGPANTEAMIFTDNVPLSTVVNGAERMRITADGNVGIGTGGFALAPTAGRIDLALNGATSSLMEFQTGGVLRGYIAGAPAGNIEVSGASFVDFVTSGTERMRIDAAGRVLVNTADAGDFFGGPTTLRVEKLAASQTALTLFGSGDGNGGFQVTSRLGAASTSGWHLRMLSGDGTISGGIYSPSVAVTQYLSGSDATMKQNIVDAPSASSIIDAIRIRSFDWIADGSHEAYGVVAQELKPYIPQAVYEPTELDMNGKWAVDLSKLVPVLTKEIQELRARVAALEAA